MEGPIYLNNSSYIKSTGTFYQGETVVGSGKWCDKAVVNSVTLTGSISSSTGRIEVLKYGSFSLTITVPEGLTIKGYSFGVKITPSGTSECTANNGGSDIVLNMSNPTTISASGLNTSSTTINFTGTADNYGECILELSDFVINVDGLTTSCVRETSQLSNTKVYTIETTRGFMTLNTAETMIVSSHKSNGGTVNDAAATDDASKQFGIFKFEDKYFLYSPKLNKFAYLQGENLVFGNDRIALDFTHDGAGNPDLSFLRFFAYKIGSEGSNKWCLNNNNSGNLVLNSYNGAEAGNTVTIKEVEGETLDEATVLAAFNSTMPFDPHKVYNITNKRVTKWTANAENTGLTGTTAYAGASAEQQQFAFFKYEGKQYLYNVGAKKFVATDGSLTDNKVEAATISTKYTGNAEYPYCFFIEERGLLFNGQGAGHFAINSWNSAMDDGNQHNLAEVADVDKYDEILAIFETPSWDVTYNIFFNGEKVATTVRTQDKDSEAGLPASMLKSFCTYDYDKTTIATGVTEVNVTATWTGPFEISPDYENAHWYNLVVRNNWFVTSDNKNAEGALKTIEANAIGLVKPAYQWSFTGNPYDGFKAFNKAEGESKVYTWVDESNAIPEFLDASTENTWAIVKGTAIANSFMFTIPGTTYRQLNQNGGAGGPLKLWTSGTTADQGSAFTVMDVPTNFAEFIPESVEATYKSEATGYFTLTDAAKAIWKDEYKTTCSYEKYVELMEALEDANNYVLPETGYYLLKNKNYGTYLGIDPSDANMYGNYKEEVVPQPKHIVKLTKTGDWTYTIGLMGKFAPATVAQSAQVTATAEAGTYTVVIPVLGYAVFKADPEVNMSCLHCAGGGSIVGWEAAADASQWQAIDAKSIKLAVEEAGYATTYLPFAVAVPEGVTAYTAEITDGAEGTTPGDYKFLTLTDAGATIPAKNAVILKATPETYVFNITTGDDVLGNNDLMGSLEPVDATGNYVLAKPEGKAVGFYKAESGKIAAGKAHLVGNTGPLAGVKAFLFAGDDATGISNLNVNVNDNSPIYNLAGQRISKMQKGINIVNGKKILK